MFEGTVATNVDYLMTVPVFIEVRILQQIIRGYPDDCLQQWASDSRKVGRMKRMKGIVSGLKRLQEKS